MITRCCLGSLLASANATVQAALAGYFGGKYGLALAFVVGCGALVIAGLAAFGVEAKGTPFGTGASAHHK